MFCPKHFILINRHFGIGVNKQDFMKRFRFAIVGLVVLTMTGLYSCEKESNDDTEYSVKNTTWIYTNDDGDGKNIFTFTDETNASFTQEWVDSGVEKSETKEGTYEYSHPDISITVGSKVYSGTVDGNTMNLGGFIYNRQ